MQTDSDLKSVQDCKYEVKIFYRYVLQLELSNVVWKAVSNYLQLLLISPVVKMLYFQISKQQCFMWRCKTCKMSSTETTRGM